MLFQAAQKLSASVFRITGSIMPFAFSTSSSLPSRLTSLNGKHMPLNHVHNVVLPACNAHTTALPAGARSSSLRCLQQMSSLTHFKLLKRGNAMDGLSTSCLARDEALTAAFSTGSGSNDKHGANNVSTAALAMGATAAVASSEGSGQAVEGADSVYKGPNLVFNVGAFVLPHPDKMDKGGEDWYFVADNKRAMGVADGVGSWGEMGVDVSRYSRMLMTIAKESADAATPSKEGSSSSSSSLSPQYLLEQAYHRTNVQGSSTACILAINGNRLLASNLGDSGFLIVRKGKVTFHSPAQQHGFNFPYQIGCSDSMGDPPTAAHGGPLDMFTKVQEAAVKWVFSLASLDSPKFDMPQAAEQYDIVVEPGDIIVVGTDGLWDNCFDNEIVQLLNYCQGRKTSADKMAESLAHYARHRAADTKFASPFAYSAFEAGLQFMGGKMDDVTVLVAIVVPEQPSKL